ncbi:unnamed protein product [Penicillium viridicatum]
MHSIFLGTSLLLLYAVSVAAVPGSSAKASSAVPSATPIFKVQNLAVAADTTASSASSWKEAQCTTDITDATLDPTARWEAAKAGDALNEALDAWSTSGAASGLGFPEFISNYFTGPDNWTADYPAGYLIMNSFSSIHQLHQQTYDALGDALNTMQNEIGHFASVFAPQAEDNSEIFKYIIDAVVLLASIGSSFAWNIGRSFKGLAMATSKWFSVGKDVTNAALVSFSTTMGKDSMQSYMSKNTLVGGYVCYNNDAFYVNINTSPGMHPFEALPGGNHQTLNGNDWGGVILEDIVQTSYQEYQLNGNANGYEMPALPKIIDGSGTEGDLVFENGIRTPGFFTRPICDDIQAASNIVEGGGAKGKYWPCDAPAGYNAGGTNVVHIQQKEKHVV